MAHVQALKRDYERLEDTYKRVNLNPLGSAAMTTTSFPINRQLTTDLFGFDAYLENSMDGVSSKGFHFRNSFLIYLHYVQPYPKSVKNLFYGALMNSAL